MNGRPRVSLVVAMRNEEAAIRQCLESIAAQTYPSDLLEVFVLDGDSTDDSIEIAESVAGPRVHWSVQANPERIQASAWNRGVSLASGEIAGIVSGHVELAPDYVERAVHALERTGAWMVGGPVRAVAQGILGQAIAVATTSRFGVGDAAHHYIDREADVDSVFMGVCRTETYRRFPFDETMIRNQDDELSYRMRKAGGRIVCDPSIRSSYHARSTIGGLWRQYFAYGFWKIEVLRRHPGQMRLRHFIPAAFVLALVGSLIAALTPLRSGLLAATLVVYAASALVASAVARGPLPRRSRALLPLVFGTLHLAYGVGFLAGLAKVVLKGPRGASPRGA